MQKENPALGDVGSSAGDSKSKEGGVLANRKVRTECRTAGLLQWTLSGGRLTIRVGTTGITDGTRDRAGQFSAQVYEQYQHGAKLPTGTLADGMCKGLDAENRSDHRRVVQA